MKRNGIMDEIITEIFSKKKRKGYIIMLNQAIG